MIRREGWRQRTAIVVDDDRRRPGSSTIGGITEEDVGAAEAGVRPDDVQPIPERTIGRIDGNRRYGHGVADVGIRHMPAADWDRLVQRIAAIVGRDGSEP